MARNISRKDFLKKSGGYAAGGLGAVTVGGTAYSYLGNSRYKSEFPVIPGNHVSLKPNGKKVLVLGGGLAGLQAACEMADRGFEVTILEKTGVPGGKLKAWKDLHFARKYFPDGYVREHGLHGVWGFYKNLREFLARHKVGLNRFDSDESFYYFISNYSERNWLIQNKTPHPTWPVPFDRLQMLLVPAMSLPPVESSNGNLTGPPGLLRPMLKLWGFDYSDREERLFLDTLTFKDWAETVGMPPEYLKHYFEGVAEMGYFMGTEECSALAIANFIRLAVTPADARIDYYEWPPDETFLNPMIKHVIAKGGRIVYNSEVTGFKLNNGRVVGVSTNEHIPPGRVRRCRVCGNLITGNQHHDHCPFCGAHHDMIETVPAQEQIARYHEADYFVVAMDVPGARKLMSTFELRDRKYFNNIMNLSTATILCVNLLYENSDAWERRFPDRDYWNAINFFPTGFKVLGFTSNWSAKQIPQLRSKKVDLIEVQVAQWQQFAGSSFREIAEAVHRELKVVVPGLPEPSDFYINRWDTYTGFRPGDERNRPGIQSPVDNLLFIGDWVSVDQHSVFMERTNVTAKMATNLLLEKEGQSDGKIEILKSGTPDWMVDSLSLFTSVKV